ncbi:Dabb family protein [Paenibacillus doosanensis]|uniref:Dabb family protein n=1 Tax=Paenibacillus doosanensis TaxID=1229154 RepID=UPI0021807FFC|nr:Dabb family protein [Paenibacillus doosanensis]MCS7462705.1 Dabb family protein [Paenibacillus doosanensis]
MEPNTIRHQVLFCLQEHATDQDKEKFLQESESVLSAIPYVNKFEVLRQVSRKNDYDYAFSMEFADQTAYDAYNVHPEHVRYVEQVWNIQVLRFLEIDLISL